MDHIGVIRMPFVLTLLEAIHAHAIIATRATDFLAI